MDIGGARAYGRIDVRGFSRDGQVIIQHYALVAPRRSLPTSLPVWRLRGFSNADTGPLAKVLGVNQKSGSSPAGINRGAASVHSSSPSAGVSAEPTDDASAIGEVTVMLDRLGILPLASDATAMDESAPPHSQWEVSFARRPIDGIPVGLGSDNAVALVRLADLAVSDMWVSAPAIDGGSPYPLRTVQDAWSDLARGHWFDECCEVYTGGDGGPDKLSFHADQVSLVYEDAVGLPDAAPGYLVPFYAFTDSQAKVSLTVPALQSTDLSEAGGFSVVEPGVPN
jgi:hypothetical protein